MPFRKYEKIHRIGKDETEGLLDGIVHIQEKVDGANTSIWLEDGVIRGGSRSQDVTGGSFNGFIPYIQSHQGIYNYLHEHPTHRLYGEWLVRHTIAYKETAYRKFYLFDVMTEDESYFEAPVVSTLAKAYNIDTVPYLGMFDRPTLEQINELVGKSEFGDRGEGVVVKNSTFVNAFGDFCYGKVVTQAFKEDNALVFGGNNKHSETYWEMFCVNKYITLARVKKCMEKIEPTLEAHPNGMPRKLDMEHIPRIIGTVYHDMISEEAWEIAGKVKSLDFFKLKSLAGKKIKQVYVDILNDNPSIADVCQN